MPRSSRISPRPSGLGLSLRRSPDLRPAFRAAVAGGTAEPSGPKGAPMRTRTRKRLIAAILLGTAASSLAVAQDAPLPKRTLIHAGKLLDVNSGRLLADQAIVIEADKIVSVGPAGAIGASSGDEVIDLSKATVLPGLIDAHTHLTMDPGDVGYEGLGIWG